MKKALVSLTVLMTSLSWAGGGIDPSRYCKDHDAIMDSLSNTDNYLKDQSYLDAFGLSVSYSSYSFVDQYGDTHSDIPIVSSASIVGIGPVEAIENYHDSHIFIQYLNSRFHESAVDVYNEQKPDELIKLSDYCKDSNTLVEYSCEFDDGSTYQSMARAKEIQCALGCVNGEFTSKCKDPSWQAPVSEEPVEEPVKGKGGKGGKGKK